PFEQEFRGQGGAGGGPAGQGGEEVLLGAGRRRLGLEDVEAPPRAGRLAGRERGVEVVPDRCHAAILTVRVARSGGRSRVPLTMLAPVGEHSDTLADLLGTRRRWLGCASRAAPIR